MVPEYLDIVKSIRENVALPVIVSTYSTNGEAVAEMLNETNAESISLYNLQKMDIMEIKQHCREANIDVDLFESSMPFEAFKLNSDGLIPCVTQHYKTGEVLMVAYMNKESYEKTIRTGRMTYWSRSRNELWTKGDNKVKADDKTYHMLDRNLGATNNGYYSPSTTALKDNKGAIGGYFKISVATTHHEAENDHFVVDALAIGNFKVCDNACLKSLVNKNVLAIKTDTTATGEVYNCLGMTTINSQIPQIFIPMSGYYEGKNNDDVPKNLSPCVWAS